MVQFLPDQNGCKKHSDTFEELLRPPRASSCCFHRVSTRTSSNASFKKPNYGIKSLSYSKLY